MDDFTTESKKQDETNASPENDREPTTQRPDAALETIRKLMPELCESELGKACEVSVNFHVYIPP